MSIVLTVAALLYLVPAVIMQTYRVPTEAMSPTLRTGDRIFASRRSFEKNPPQRGDLVVFAPEAGGRVFRRIDARRSGE